MSKFTDEFIRQQREIAAKATPRPWVAEWNCEPRVKGGTVKFYEGWAETPTLTGDTLSEVESQANSDRLYMESAANNYPGALAEIERLREAQRWIPVSERLPEIGEFVLVRTVSGKMRVWHRVDDIFEPGWMDGLGVAYSLRRVTHWMPLPEPPQEDDKGQL